MKAYRSQIAILFLAAVIITLLMPRTSSSTYVYEVNSPWNYPALIAPFEIPVNPDSAKVRQIRDSVDNAFIPVFHRDVAADEFIRQRMESALGKVNGVSYSTSREVLRKINELYNNGVVSEDVYADITSGDLKQIRLAKGSNLSLRSAEGMRSPIKAYEWLKEQLPSEEAQYAVEQSKIATMLHPNIVLDTMRSSRLRQDIYARETMPRGVIPQGARIVDRGDIITPQVYTNIRTYELKQAENGNIWNGKLIYVWLAKFLYVALLMGVLATFLFFFRRKLWRNLKVVVFLAGCLVVFSLFAFIMASSFVSGLYLVPLCILPIMVLVFFDGRTAMFTHIVQVLICTVSATSELEFFFMQFIAGCVAINSLKELSRRSQLLRTAVLVFLSYSLAYVAVNVMLSGSFKGLQPRIFGYVAINSVLVSFTYVLIFVFERLFGFSSLVALVELSDINHPLLRELSRTCPGTFQHSIAVSNLAAEAAAEIEADVQLVRAGALYHDIGKLSNPNFFTENQHGASPHEPLDPIVSAGIITRHVTNGLERAEKARLPKPIKDFIAQHHGKGTARYFYMKYCKEHPDEEVDPAPFTYVGPNPQSREASILMMADAVEAASRSLKDYTEESIRELVNRIVDTQIQEGLHNESPISFKDIRTVKESFIHRLMTIYHSRIAYLAK